jgi:hypothetical protein
VELVALEIGIVCRPLRLKAPAPIVVDIEAAVGLYVSARILPGLPLVVLVAPVGARDTAGALDFAFRRALAVFAGHHGRLTEKKNRLDGGVAALVDHDVVRHADELSQVAGRLYLGGEKAALPVNRAVWMRKIRRIDQRHAEKLHAGIVVPDLFRRLVVGDPRRLDLPHGSAGRILLAKIARTVNGATRDRRIAAAAPGTDGRQPRLIGEKRPEVLYGAVAQVVGQLNVVGEDDVARRFGNAYIACRADDIVQPVERHDIGPQDPLALRNLDIAPRRDDAELLVVVHLVGGDQGGQAGRGTLRRGGQRQESRKSKSAGEKRDGYPPPPPLFTAARTLPKTVGHRCE